MVGMLLLSWLVDLLRLVFCGVDEHIKHWVVGGKCGTTQEGVAWALIIGTSGIDEFGNKRTCPMSTQTWGSVT